MRSRTRAMGRARVAGYHSDNREFTRLLVESGISLSVLKAEWEKGVQARQSGTVCVCFTCKALAPAVRP